MWGGWGAAVGRRGRGQGSVLGLQLLQGPCGRLCFPSLSGGLGGAADGSRGGSPTEDGVDLTWTCLSCRLVSVWPGRPAEGRSGLHAHRGSECRVLDPPRRWIP